MHGLNDYSIMSVDGSICHVMVPERSNEELLC